MTTSAVPDELVARLRSICLALPETYEEPAWTGTRWRVRHKTFAHILTIADGWPPAYASAAHTDGPAHVVMVRSTDDELEALRQLGPPYFPTPWRSDEIGVHLTADTDWTEITELVSDSYRNQAPRGLANTAIQPSPTDDGDR